MKMTTAIRVALISLVACVSASAQNGTWTNAVDAPDSFWSATTNWLNGVVANGAGNTATFSNELSALVTVNLDTPRTVANLDFQLGTYTITNNGADAVNLLTLAGPSKPMISIPAGMAATIRRTVLAGTDGFVLDGGGQLNLFKGGTEVIPQDPPNQVTGTVILSNGWLQVQGNDVSQEGDPNANDPALDGIESFTFYNGSTLNMVPDGSTSPSYGSVNANWIVPAGHSGTIAVPPRWSGTGETGGSGMDGTLTGGGTLNLQVRYLRGNIGGDWSAFIGQINVAGAAGADSQWRFGSAAGFPNAVVNLTGTIAVNARYYPAPGGEVIIPIGALVSDNTLASLNGGNGGTTMVTFRIGALRTSATDVDVFQGALFNNTGMRIVKEGAGTWMLVGNSDHSGGTIISNGVVQVGDGFSESGSLGTGSITNYGALVLARGGSAVFLNAISGSGSLTNSGSGFVTLSSPLKKSLV